jgi:hypothetical protein
MNGRAIMEAAQERVRPSPARRRVLWAGGIILAGAVLMFCYLRIAGVTGMNSDGAGIVRQAAGVLHGNVLLRGWADTDVSFYTTELVEYSAVTLVTGVRPEVVHICAALTYLLLVLLAALVARGSKGGAGGLAGALLAAAVMLAPQAAAPGETFVLLGSPDHFGTAVPLLLLLLLLDRPGPRWYVPAGTCVLLAWSIVGDPLLEVIAVVPLVLACLARAGRIAAVRSGARSVAAGQRGPVAWRELRYEASVAAAAVAAVPLATVGYGLVRHFGGYRLGPQLYNPVPLRAAAQDVPLAWQGVLEIFSADYPQAHGAWNCAIALAHLAGVALVIISVALACWRLLCPARDARLGDRVADVLVLALLGNIAAYLIMIRITSLWDAHEIAPVLPAGAALAGRMLGGPLGRLRARGFAVLAPFLLGSAALLGVAAAAPQGAPQSVQLAAWLQRHHLTHGMSSYWMASSTSVDSGGAISMLSVSIHGYWRKLAPDAWENDLTLDNPLTNSVNFFVTQTGEDDKRRIALHMFGEPLHTYGYLKYTIMVWNKNLLSGLGPPPQL